MKKVKSEEQKINKTTVLIRDLNDFSNLDKKVSEVAKNFLKKLEKKSNKGKAAKSNLH